MKRKFLLTVTLLTAVLFACTGHSYTRESQKKSTKPHKGTISDTFKVPGGLETEVGFWKNIYSKYDKGRVVIHDTKYLDIVYDVVDISDIYDNNSLSDEEKRSRRSDRIDAIMAKIKTTLLELAQTPDIKNPTADQQKIITLFKSIKDSDKYKEASDCIRSQTGQKDKFISGIITSGRYMTDIEAIFQKEGLPKELTRLVFVESMFNTRALSKVGASGIWQFMPGTGRLFVTINQFIDERNDPIKATYAAARLLKKNYELLGSWPLALNAYNTGALRMLQAKRQLGTSDIEKIVHNFKGSGYGFASRNFYCEFLAALDTYENFETYFGQLEVERPLVYDEISVAESIPLDTLSGMADTDTASLIALNPGLRDEVVIGRLAFPSGFSLRVPAGKAPKFLAAIEKYSRDNTNGVRKSNFESRQSTAKPTLKPAVKTHKHHK